MTNLDLDSRIRRLEKDVATSRRQVVVLVGVVGVLGAFALSRTGGTAHADAPPQKLSFVDGKSRVDIDAHGITVVEGGHRAIVTSHALNVGHDAVIVSEYDIRLKGGPQVSSLESVRETVLDSGSLKLTSGKSKVSAELYIQGDPVGHDDVPMLRMKNGAISVAATAWNARGVFEVESKDAIVQMSAKDKEADDDKKAAADVTAMMGKHEAHTHVDDSAACTTVESDVRHRQKTCQ